MAKRAVKGAEEHYCGECALAEWDMSFRNLDVHGKPFCLRCPHSEWVRLRKDVACGWFVKE